jgi:hypothetical protein
MDITIALQWKEKWWTGMNLLGCGASSIKRGV